MIVMADGSEADFFRSARLSKDCACTVALFNATGETEVAATDITSGWQKANLKHRSSHPSCRKPLRLIVAGGSTIKKRPSEENRLKP